MVFAGNKTKEGWSICQPEGFLRHAKLDRLTACDKKVGATKRDNLVGKNLLKFCTEDEKCS